MPQPPTPTLPDTWEQPVWLFEPWAGCCAFCDTLGGRIQLDPWKHRGCRCKLTKLEAKLEVISAKVTHVWKHHVDIRLVPLRNCGTPVTGPSPEIGRNLHIYALEEWPLPGDKHDMPPAVYKKLMETGWKPEVVPEQQKLWISAPRDKVRQYTIRLNNHTADVKAEIRIYYFKPGTKTVVAEEMQRMGFMYDWWPSMEIIDQKEWDCSVDDGGRPPKVNWG